MSKEVTGVSEGDARPSEEELTTEIAGLFARELEVADVGADSHFLFLGGDSLDAERLILAIGSHFSLKLQTATLLDAPTPRALARVVAALLDKRQAIRK